MATLSEVIDLYLADRKAKGTKKNTLRNDASVLRNLLSEVGNIQTRNLRIQHLDTFWLSRSGWQPGTINKVRANLNTFIQWCQRRGYIAKDIDLMGGTRKLTVPPRNRIIIPQAEFETFLDGIQDPRKRAVAAIGLYLFTRLSETSALRWQDVDLDSKRPTVQVFRPKTNTMDSLPICAELDRELRRWKLVYASLAKRPVEPGWYVIPGIRPGHGYGTPGTKGFTGFVDNAILPLHPPKLQYVALSILKDAGYYQSHEGGHTLRRSGAIALYNQLSRVGHDRSIRICQAMLGHRSVRTTELYLMLDLDQKVRNDLLAGKPMFPETTGADVIELSRKQSGPENDSSVRM